MAGVQILVREKVQHMVVGEGAGQSALELSKIGAQQAVLLNRTAGEISPEAW